MTRAVALLALAACHVDPHADPADRVARLVDADTPDIGDLVAGNDAFAWALYGELAEEGENLFFSPLSVSAALGMTSAGAAGATLEQLRDGLAADLPADRWHAAFGALIDDLNGAKSRGYDLRVANRLFGQEGTAWGVDFLATCEDDWHAPLQDTDFAGDAEGSRQTINGWVSDNTDGRIDELFPAGVISADTRLVLTNAITFTAQWWSQFDKADTRDATFTREDGSTVTVDMMWLYPDDLDEHRVSSTSTSDAEIVRLPYEDDEVSAYVIIPHEGTSLAEVEAGLPSFDTWIADLGQPGSEGTVGVPVGLPRFELRTKVSLLPALRALGIVDLFDGALADLSPMTSDGASAGWYVSEVLHEAWVKVDEEGTEAAAATGVVVDEVSAPEPLVADRPFVFVVRDDLTGSLLFVARVADPTAG